MTHNRFRRFIPSGGLTSAHPIIESKSLKECAFCGYPGPFRLWPEADLDLDAAIAMPTFSGFYALCVQCDREEQREYEDRMLGVAPTRVKRLFSEQPMAAPTPAPVYAPKCTSPHHTQMLGPEGYGYLRMTSLRGGWIVDTDCDYALFFDKGWNAIAEPQVVRYDPSGRGEIPLFGEKIIDKSIWPSIAFVNWPDMKPPTAEVVRAATWVAEQWAEGKNVQFGCFGAHGRTGTFLAMILLKAGMAVDAADATKQVHEGLCKDAVETKSQEEFLVAYAKEVVGSEQVAPTT